MGNGNSTETKESRRSKMRQKIQNFRSRRRLRRPGSGSVSGLVSQRSVSAEDFAGIALLTLIGVRALPFLLSLLILLSSSTLTTAYFEYDSYVSLRFRLLESSLRRRWSSRTSGSPVFPSGNKPSVWEFQIRRFLTYHRIRFLKLLSWIFWILYLTPSCFWWFFSTDKPIWNSVRELLGSVIWSAFWIVWYHRFVFSVYRKRSSSWRKMDQVWLESQYLRCEVITVDFLLIRFGV